MKFSANPGPDVLGLTIHLIPQVNLRLNALFNATSTSVYLYFDASLGLHGNVSSGNKPQSCLSGNAGINAEMGTQGSFFNKFRNSTGRSTFKKNFTLFQVRAYTPLSIFFLNIYHSLDMTTALLRRELQFVEFHSAEFQLSEFKFAGFESAVQAAGSCS